jgi:hypothetical protein
MKSIIAILVYAATFLGFFFLISLVGLLWFPTYKDVITSVEWFIIYTLTLGWWLSFFPLREYYMKHKKYFQNNFVINWMIFISLCAMTSCCGTSSICKKPTKRELKKAMSYSSWEYVAPSLKSSAF